MQCNTHSPLKVVSVRVYLAYAFGLVHAVLASLVIFPRQDGSIDGEQQGQSTSAIARDLRQVQIEIATNNLDFPVKTSHGLIEGQEADLESLRKYQKLLSKEMKRYPVSLVHSSNLIRVVLCEELKFDGQRRNAIPDFEHDVFVS